jgi:hypothetical protein
MNYASWLSQRTSLANSLSAASANRRRLQPSFEELFDAIAAGFRDWKSDPVTGKPIVEVKQTWSSLTLTSVVGRTVRIAIPEGADYAVVEPTLTTRYETRVSRIVNPVINGDAVWVASQPPQGVPFETFFGAVVDELLAVVSD